MLPIRYIIKTYREAFSGLPREAWLLSLVMLVNRSGTMVLFFLSLYLTDARGFSPEQAGLLISLFGLGGMAGSYLGGWFSDHVGPWRVQFISLLFGGIGYILLGYMRQEWSIGLTLFITSVIGESTRPANITAMAQICAPEIRARGFALNRLAINLGMAVGPVIGGLIIAWLDYLYIFWIDGVTCLAAAGGLWIAFHAHHAAESSAPVSKGPIRSPFRDRPFLFLLSILLLMGLVFSQVFSTWPLYLKNVSGFLEPHIGLFMAVNTLLIALVEMPLVHKVEKHDPLKVILLGAGLLFVGFFIMPFGAGAVFIVLTVILWTVGEMLVFPLTGSLIAERSPEKARGKYMGLFTLTFSVAFVLGPLSGAWVYDNLAPDFVWYGAGIVGLLAVTGLAAAQRFLRNS